MSRGVLSGLVDAIDSLTAAIAEAYDDAEADDAARLRVAAHYLAKARAAAQGTQGRQAVQPGHGRAGAGVPR